MTEDSRPTGYINGVIVPPRVAYQLERSLTELSRLRTNARGSDDEMYQTLHALHWTAVQWAASANGSTQRKAPEGTVNWYTPTTIAGQLRVTPHAVRLAIREGRLRAVKDEYGHWQVAPADYYTFRQRHRGAAQ